MLDIFDGVCYDRKRGERRMYTVQLFFRKEAHEYLGKDQHLPLDPFYVDLIENKGYFLEDVAKIVYKNGYEFLRDNGDAFYYPPDTILFVRLYKAEPDV